MEISKLRSNDMIGGSISHIIAVICRQRALFAALLFAAVMSAGCSNEPKLVTAGGTVTYEQKPVPGADVVFVPDAGGPPVIGRTDDQGRFSVDTDGKPGAFVGSYKVAVTAVRQKRAVSDAEAVGMTSEQIYANHETLIPIKYNNQISSGLTATVSDDPAKNEYRFELR